MRDKKRTKKKKGRILVETGIITSALFLVLILAIMTMIYTGIVRLHLDDQKDKMRSELVRAADSINDTDVSDWFLIIGRKTTRRLTRLRWMGVSQMR